MREIARIHSVPKEFFFNTHPKFTSNFRKGLFKGFGTNINFSTTYHPKSHGEMERVNHVLEYMIRMHVIHKP
jgi:hypothetical protein